MAKFSDFLCRSAVAEFRFCCEIHNCVDTRNCDKVLCMRGVRVDGTGSHDDDNEDLCCGTRNLMLVME